jgi:hypothetical protein
LAESSFRKVGGRKEGANSAPGLLVTAQDWVRLLKDWTVGQLEVGGTWADLQPKCNLQSRLFLFFARYLKNCTLRGSLCSWGVGWWGTFRASQQFGQLRVRSGPLHHGCGHDVCAMFSHGDLCILRTHLPTQPPTHPVSVPQLSQDLL